MKKTSWLTILLCISLFMATACGSADTNSSTMDAATEDSYSGSSSGGKQNSTSNGSWNTTDREESYQYNTTYDENNPGGNYDSMPENQYASTTTQPLSTVSIDVDTASYANIRRYLNDYSLPPTDAVRIEELINYFSYDYPLPTGDIPFTIINEVVPCPWDSSHYLAKVALQADTLETRTMAPQNLVFLVDVSGSMNQSNKLPLLIDGLRLLTAQLGSMDTVSIVTYASGVNVQLHGAKGNEKKLILDVLDSLEAGGSTSGQSGIQLAYEVALQYFNKEGNNRIILCTDGDFNVGMTDEDELCDYIASERERSNIYLSILGFGMDNLNDSLMKKLSINGAGNYYYIDTLNEAKKVLLEDLPGTLNVLAEDVKLQIEFNPATISEYRLVGYENRVMANQDFSNDAADAGELGAGHTVTFFYELIPNGVSMTVTGGEDLRYQDTPKVDENASSDYYTVKLRYKEPGASNSQLLEQPVTPENFSMTPSSETAFANAVAEWGLLLSDSQYKGNASYASILSQAEKGLNYDPYGYRAEFIQLVETSQLLQTGLR